MKFPFFTGGFVVFWGCLSGAVSAHDLPADFTQFTAEYKRHFQMCLDRGLQGNALYHCQDVETYITETYITLQFSGIEFDVYQTLPFETQFALRAEGLAQYLAWESVMAVWHGNGHSYPFIDP